MFRVRLRLRCRANMFGSKFDFFSAASIRCRVLSLTLVGSLKYLDNVGRDTPQAVAKSSIDR